MQSACQVKSSMQSLCEARDTFCVFFSGFVCLLAVPRQCLCVEML
jgi:hypothetical protein